MALNWTREIGAVSVCLGVMFGSTFLVVQLNDLGKSLFPGMILQLGGLLFLPHGVALLSTWVLGWRAFLPLFAATVFALALGRGIEAVTVTMLLLMAVKAATMPAAFDLFRLCKIDARGDGAFMFNWRLLMLIGFLSSMLNNLWRYMLNCCGDMTASKMLAAYSLSIFGDMMGVLVVMLGMMLVFRHMRQRQLRAQV